MTDPIPDRTVFMAAARRQCEIDYPGQDVASSLVASYAANPGFRAAVDSAYRAGYGQGRDDEAAGLDMPRTWAIPDEPGPEVTAAKLANGQILDHIGEDRWQYRVSASERKRGIVGSCTNWDGMVRMGPVVDASGDPR
jgi:hypothetical protein